MEWAIALALAVGIPAATLGARLVRSWRIRRGIRAMLKKTPLRSIREVSAGRELVAIQGKLRPLRTIQCPLTGAPVIGYRISISFVQPSDSEHSMTHHQAFELAQIAPFEVVDDSAMALVRGQPFLLLAQPHQRSKYQLAVDLTRPELAQMVLEQGFSTTDLVMAKDVTCTWRQLQPHSTVYVLGQAIREADLGGEVLSYREPPSRLVLQPPTRGPMLVADCRLVELMADLRSRIQ